MITQSQSPCGRELTLFDAITNASTTVTFDSTTSCSETAGAFPRLVDRAWNVECRRLTIDRIPSIVIRNEEGTVVTTAMCSDADLHRVTRSCIELGTPVKLYVIADGPMSVSTDKTSTTIELDMRQSVQIGARGKHDRPTQTVRTTEDTEDLFQALSTFAALDHPQGPERSFPGYRRHPPALECSDKLHIPADLSDSETELRIEVPATYLHAAMAAPLGYYLGAELVAGPTPGIYRGGKRLTDWPNTTAIEQGCASLLRRVVFLDCIARTEQGGYNLDLAARSQLNQSVDLSWKHLAKRTMSERLQTYLSIPKSTIDACLPPWTERASIVPVVDTIEALPHLAFDLTSIHPMDASAPTAFDHISRRGPQSGAVQRQSRMQPALETDVPYVLASRHHRRQIGPDSVYSTAMANRRDRNDNTSEILITVVCNDRQMLVEHDSVGEIYHNRPTSATSVRRHAGVSVDELKSILTAPTDYFHFIGHIENGGFDCRDGIMDAQTLGNVGVEIFFLNACNSIRQGRGLINAGAIGGIVTQRPITNRGAVTVGESLATLLTRGYPLGTTLQLAEAQNAFVEQYSVIGDPRVELGDTESGVPYLCLISTTGEEYEVQLCTILTSTVRKGSVTTFHLNDDERWYLNPTQCRHQVDEKALRRFLTLEEVLVRWRDEWMWSSEFLNILN